MNNNEYNLDEEEMDGESQKVKPDQAKSEDIEEYSSVNINRYHDQDGVSMSKLELGLWYVENKVKIIESTYFLFFLLGLVSWCYFFYEFGTYIVKGIPANKLIVQEVLANNLPDYSYYVERKPVDLQLYPVKIITGTGNKSDILAKINNPNKDHWARFTYYFLNNGEEMGRKKSFILPGDTKQLLVLGQDIPTSIGGLRLMIEDIEWGRVNSHEFGVWEDFKKSHLDLKFSNIAFTPSESSSLTEKIPLNSLSFYVENNTSFNYWNVPLIISLYNYSDLVSVTTYEINDFESTDKFDINFTLPGNFRKVTNIEIVADLDISRMDLYKEFETPKGIFR